MTPGCLLRIATDFQRESAYGLGASLRARRNQCVAGWRAEDCPPYRGWFWPFSRNVLQFLGFACYFLDLEGVGEHAFRPDVPLVQVRMAFLPPFLWFWKNFQFWWGESPREPAWARRSGAKPAHRQPRPTQPDACNRKTFLPRMDTDEHG